MDRILFARRLREASVYARDFAREFIREALPDRLRFRVRLNSSYDGNPRVGDEAVYPEDSAFQTAMMLHDVSEDDVVATLWRDGHVPEWVNLSVIGETGTATLMDVVCCGRFTADDNLLYHTHEGRPPFHVLGPTLPINYADGDRFSIYNRAECWTPADYERAVKHSKDVWSLELVGPAFAHASLASIHPFPGLEILELKQTPIEGAGLSGLARLPRLRVLRVHFAPVSRIDFSEVPSLPALRMLDLAGLPPRVFGVSRLGATAGLEWLTLSAVHRVHLDAELPELSMLQRFSLTVPELPGSAFPRAPLLRYLSLHLEKTSDSELLRAVSRYPQLESLSLRGTPVTDAFLDRLDRWPDLTYLNVVNTRVTQAALQRLPAARPKLQFYPRTDM